MKTALAWHRVHLQFILDLAGMTPRDAARIAADAVWGGVDSIQVRAKGMGAGPLLQATRLVRETLRSAGLSVPVLVNDRLDVALLGEADGVHLPESPWPPQWADWCRRLAAAAVENAGPARPFAVGRSIHSVAAADLPGTDQLDYVMFGHIFSTASKPGLAPRGVAALAHAAARAPVPVIAVGGITPANAGEAVAAGAAGVAVIRAIRDAPDPAKAAATLREAIDHARPPGSPVDPEVRAGKEERRCGSP